jgi:TolA-binding protein
MKGLLMLTLTVCAFAQTPTTPKTGKEADAQITQLYKQIGALQVKLAKNHQYHQLKELQDQLHQMQIRARVLHNQESEMEALARHKAAEAAKKQP